MLGLTFEEIQRRAALLRAELARDAVDYALAALDGKVEAVSDRQKQARGDFMSAEEIVRRANALRREHPVQAEATVRSMPAASREHIDYVLAVLHWGEQRDAERSL